MSSAETSARTVGLGIVLGAVATLLTYKHAMGLGFALYGVVLVVALLAYARVQGVKPAYRNLFMVAPVLFFALMLAIRSELDLTFLNLCAAVAAALLLIYFFTSGNISQQSLIAYPTKTFVSAIAVGVQPVSEIEQSRKWLASRRGVWGRLAPFVRGAAITVPVVAVFIILFSSADEVFSRLMRNIVNALFPQNASDLILQLVFTGIFAWVAIGGLAFALLERKAKRAPTEAAGEPPADEPVVRAIRSIPGLGFTETIMLLGSVCLVFAAFVAIQFVYLFGGAQNLANFSYADYVHRGFAELVVVAILTLGLVLALNAISARRTGRQANIFHGLSTVLVLLTGVILVSAFQRLRLYELAYGFTTLRLLIYVLIVWLGVLFAGFTLSLYWTPATINVFSLTTLIAMFGVVATLDVLNPDAFVAWQNVNRGDIDPVYLSTLSEEAVPVLVSLVDAPEPGLRAVIRSTLLNLQNSLGWYRTADWRDYSLGRSSALAALDNVKDKITQSPTLRKTLDDLRPILRKGMTTRAVARELGLPDMVTSPAASAYSNRASDRLVDFVYMLADNTRVRLRFDTAQGLDSACVTDLYLTCQEILPVNP